MDSDLRCVTFGDPFRDSTSAFVPAAAPGPATPLFLVPALGLDGRSFSPLAPVAAERRVVFWNPPNDLPVAVGLDALAALTIEHADRAGMPRRFVLGGSSLGAMVALATAIAAPERVAGLVLTGGAARWSDLGAPMRLARLLHPFLPRRSYHKAMAVVLVPSWGEPDVIARELRRQVEHRTKDYARAVIEALAGGSTFDLTARLRDVKAPTLVVHSLRDAVAPWRAAKRLATIPNAELVAVEGAAHLPYLGDPDRFLAALRPFLSRVDAAEAAR